MRCWGAVCLVALVGCYRGPSGLTPCSVRCTEGCPSGTSCVNGYCSSGGDVCGGGDDGGVVDAQCGAAGAACCPTAPGCVDNAYCMAGTCQPGCVANISDVALGRHFMCVLDHDGSVWCSGTNDNGELATGSAGGAAPGAFVHATDAIGPIDDATAVCSGFQHACAVRAGGTVSCWGYGPNGQLGNNMYTDSPLGVQVVDAAGTPITGMAKLACGVANTCALASDSSVWCWGDNFYGELGDNTGASRATAAQVPGLTGVTTLQSGHYFVCSLDTVGQIRCWGRNDHGQVGDGTLNIAYAPFAVSLANVTAVATGSSHACALLSDSSMDCWGSNTRRWIGTGVGRNVDVLSPSPVLQPDGTTHYSGVSAIALGSVSCALRGDNVDCWGDDVHGQTANGGSFYPRPVTTGARPLGKVDGIVGHYSHVCAHQSDGAIVCWGRNEAGEFGDGTFRNRGYPVPLGPTCAATN